MDTVYNDIKIKHTISMVNLSSGRTHILCQLSGARAHGQKAGKEIFTLIAEYLYSALGEREVCLRMKERNREGDERAEERREKRGQVKKMSEKKERGR